MRTTNLPERILLHLKKHDGANAEALAKALETNPRHVSKHLLRMLDKEHVRREFVYDGPVGSYRYHLGRRVPEITAPVKKTTPKKRSPRRSPGEGIGRGSRRGGR